MKNKRFLITMLVVLVAGAGASLILRWYITRPVTTVVTEKDIREQLLSIDGALPQQQQTVIKPIPIGRPVRLAIGALGFDNDEQNQRLADLVLVALADTPGLDLVERQSLNAVLIELNLSLSGLLRAKDAVRAGKMLKADWFLLGTTTKIGGTNSVVARIVDAQTGILRNAALFSADQPLPQLAGDMAAFIKQSRQDAASAKTRLYLAIGAFADLSLNNRLASFPDQLRGYLMAAYKDSDITLLEREYVETLLHEVQLDLAGLTEDAGSNQTIPMQSAFWLVTGEFQSYETTNVQVELNLDIQRIFGRMQRFNLRGLPTDEIASQVKNLIDRALKQSTEIVVPTRVSETRAQLRKGKELMGIADSMWPDNALVYVHPFTDLKGAAWLRRERNLQEAIRAFQTVLLLDPGNREAKMHLAACFRDPVIHRIDEARNYYRELIEENLQDKWSKLARTALVRSFEWWDPEDAARWFGSAAAQTANPDAAAFYRQQAEIAGANAISQRAEGPKAIELAEKRLFEVIRSYHDYLRRKIHGTQPYRLGMRDFVRVFGSDQEKAAQRLAELLPKMIEHVPDIEPYLVAAVLASQTSTNTPVLATFEQSLEWCIAHPTNVINVDEYWTSACGWVYEWCFERKHYALALKLMEGHRRAAEQARIRFGEQERIKLAYAYMGVQRWKDALDILETFSGKPVLPGSYGPWGRAMDPILTDKMAAYCREQLGLPKQGDPRRFDLGPSYTRVGAFSSLAADPEGLWLAVSAKLIRLDFDVKTNFVIELPIDPYTRITCVLPDDEKIWLGTDGAGLVEVDKSTRKCRRLTEADGLMMDHIQCLHRAGDTLWIGYGSKVGGGLGQFHIPSQKPRSFMGTLAPGTASQPPRKPVSSITCTPDGNVLTLISGFVWQFNPSNNSWRPLPQKNDEQALCFAADSSRLVLGLAALKAEVEIEERLSTSAGTNQVKSVKLVVPREELDQLRMAFATNKSNQGIIKKATYVKRGEARVCSFQDQKCQTISDPNVLLEPPTALTLNGDDLWLGGDMYIALLDLKENTVKKFAFIRARHVHKIHVAGGYLWTQLYDYLFRMPLSEIK